MAISQGVQNRTAVIPSLSLENVKSRFKTITEDCLRIPSGREAVILVFLAGAGVLGNYLSLSLFFGVDFIFGSIATMIALRVSGTLWGTVVGVAVGRAAWNLFSAQSGRRVQRLAEELATEAHESSKKGLITASKDTPSAEDKDPT